MPACTVTSSPDFSPQLNVENQENIMLSGTSQKSVHGVTSEKAKKKYSRAGDDSLPSLPSLTA